LVRTRPATPFCYTHFGSVSLKYDWQFAYSGDWQKEHLPIDFFGKKYRNALHN
jgi:hypothetical protein